MRVMKQGADYEEDDVNVTQEGEGEESTSAGLSKIAGIPVKVLVIGGAVLVLLVLFVAVFGGKEADADDDIVIPANQDDYQTPSSVVEQTPTQQDEFYTWYTSDGQYLGMSLGMQENTLIADGSTTTAIISSTGTTQVMNDRGAYANATLQTPTQQSVSSYESNGYTEEMIDKLRGLGYTGDEINAAIRDNFDYDSLVSHAQELRDAEAVEALKRMADHESDEFKYLLNWSIFSFPHREFTPMGDENVAYNMENNYLVNADYEKVDTYGLQLFIKVKIANNTYVYMEVSPARWETLPQSGNIVVRVYYTRYGTLENNDVYVTKLEEQDITHITVNPEDSSVDFYEMTAQQ